MKDGLGTESYISKATYVGSYRRGLKHGKGKVTFSDRKHFFDGNFKNDRKDGHGVLSVESHCYDGEWVNDVK
jgi:hypothetical protein